MDKQFTAQEVEYFLAEGAIKLSLSTCRAQVVICLHPAIWFQVTNNNS